MNHLELDTKLAFIVVSTFLLAYLFTFPTGWLISDVYSYMNQGIAISKGENLLSYLDAVTGQTIPYKASSYPLGNASWIAICKSVFGLKHVYLGSLIITVISSVFLFKILSKESSFKLAVFLLFLYPSLAFFSNTLMSCMPSLLMTSLFLFVLFNRHESGQKWLILSFIAVLSFWIRETNIILLGGICLIHFLIDRRWFLYFVSGTLLGFIPRLVSSYYFYNDPFHYLLAEGFAFDNILKNVSVYSIILLGFMPLGLLFLARYRGRYWTPIVTSSFLFISTYLCYSFNATSYSGFNKGVILMGRFMIPILPIFILSVGWHFRKKTFSKSIKILVSGLICVVIIGMQIQLHREAKIHKNITNQIYSNYNSNMVLFDLSRTTNVIRYINPFHGELENFGDIANLQNDEYMNALFLKFDDAILIQTLNTANADKEQYTSRINNLIKDASLKYNIETIENTKIKPALYLQVFKIYKKHGK